MCGNQSRYAISRRRIQFQRSQQEHFGKFCFSETSLSLLISDEGYQIKDDNAEMESDVCITDHTRLILMKNLASSKMNDNLFFLFILTYGR